MASQRSNKVRGADIPQRIVEQATRLFAARGFVGASLRDIAASVGIRKPSLLYHFASKEELRRRVLEEMLGRWNEVLPKLLVAATAGPAQFDAVVQETVAFFREDPDRARLVLRQILDHPDETRPLLEQHVMPWAQIVANYIRKGQVAGRVRADVDPEAYVFNMINLLVSGVAAHAGLTAALGGTEADSERVMQRHIDEMVRVAKSSLFINPELYAEKPSAPDLEAAAQSLGGSAGESRGSADRADDVDGDEGSDLPDADAAAEHAAE